MRKPPDLLAKLMEWERVREPTRQLHKLLSPPAYRSIAMSESQMMARAQVLLAAGARPNSRRPVPTVFPVGTNGVPAPLRQSPLASAATLGYPKLTKMLLDAGARPDKSAVALLVDNLNAIANFEPSWNSPRATAMIAVAEVLAAAPAEEGLWDKKFSQAIFEHRNAPARPEIPARQIVENYCPNAAGCFPSSPPEGVSRPEPRQARM
jgi:hypothetical protein